MSMELNKLKQIIEAALMAAGSALKLEQIMTLFEGDEDAPGQDEVMQAIHGLMEDCAQRGVELKEVSSGFRFQARQEFSQWVQRLWEERPQRYSRALLETLALIAYRQPITRAEIEEVRGVSVSSTIIKTLQEREWVRVVGHRDVPGKPAMYATTRDFLDYFNLQNLDELPTLAEIRDIDSINAELAFEEAQAVTAEGEEGGEQTTAESMEMAPELEGMEPSPVSEEKEEFAVASESTVEDEEEEFLSDDELKAIDALNLSLRDNIHGSRQAAEEDDAEPGVEALAQQERELESDVAGEADVEEEQDTRP